jgi:uncharacterized protein YndB with AHSA1/START domain
MASSKFGVLTKENDGYQIIFDRVLPHDAPMVWAAITDPAKMKHWFFETEIDFKVGGRIIFKFGDPDNSESYGKITRIEYGKLFEYIWENTGGGPDELATWELFREGKSKTRLRLTYSRLSEKYGSLASGGWHIMLDHLEEVLDGRTEPFPYTGGQSDDEKGVAGHYAKVVEKLR